jgi:hypothetical protein
MTIYKQKKIVIIPWTITFVFLAIMSVYFYILLGEFFVLAIAVGFVIFAFIFLFSGSQIITDSDSIKKKVFGKVYQELRWNWIYDVKTFRLTEGTYATVLSFARDPEGRSGGLGWIFRKDPTKGAFAVSAHFSDYVALLKEIKEKAMNADFDETTEKIIREGIQLSTPRKIFWVAAILFLIGVLIYLVSAFTS